MKISAMLLCDFYKISHREQYPDKTQIVYSTWTPRISRIEGIDEIVVFGHQAFIQKYLIEFFDEHFFKRSIEDVLTEYVRIIKHTLGITQPPTKHISDLHALGKLPLLIKSLPEGTVVPLRTPVLTIQNMEGRFFWLTNYIETLASCEMWKASTSATIARHYRKIFNRYAMETTGNTDGVGFQGHDFSMRGMSGLDDAISSGMGHLLSFTGTDSIPSIVGLENYYFANIETELVGASIPATEHSVMCANGSNSDEEEFAAYERLITQVYPNGFVSIVSDTRDFWNILARVILPLKDKIMARDGRLVIRPDSGDPVKIMTGDDFSSNPMESKGLIEVLWDIFGGVVNEKGFKVLDSHIGAIYGEAITFQRAEEICKRLKDKGFASTNAIFGIGSYTYQYNTRDTFGFAYKSTACVIDGKEYQLFKNPKTDDGSKKSQKGRVVVTQDEKGQISHTDGHSLTEIFPSDLLKTLFVDGSFYKFNKISDMRARIQQKN